MQSNLIKQDAVKVKPFLIISDKKGNVIFSKWANFIKRKESKDIKQRHFWIKMFKYYLLFAIWVVSPVVFILFLLTYIFSLPSIKKDKIYYMSVNTK